MANINCEICGGSKFIKQNGMFICSDCGTSYSLEDARSLLQNNTATQLHRDAKCVQGVVCPLCGGSLYEKDGYYVCFTKDCGYKYSLINQEKINSNYVGKTEMDNPINYIGTCKTSTFTSKNIRVTNEGIELGGVLYPIESITGFQFKAVKHSTTFYYGRYARVKLFTVPTGTTFKASFTVNGEYSFDCTGDKKFLSFNKSEYGDFIDALWKAASYNIIRNILLRLKNNEEVSITDNNVTLLDTGIKVTEMNFFSADKEYFYTWDEARKHMLIKHEDGGLRIEFDDVKYMGGNLFFTLGMILNDNANILEELLTYAKNNRIARLSDLL